MFLPKKQQSNCKTKQIWSRILSALLAFIFVLSTAMTAFAWSDFTQSKTNTFKGTVSSASVLLHKYEKDQGGNIQTTPVANAQFKLFKEQSDGTYKQIGELYLTDAKGQINVKNLGAGKYYFEEINPGYGYNYDKNGSEPITKYYFVITDEYAQQEATVEVTAYNRRKESSLEIKKIVAVAPGQTLPEEDKNKEFTFTVTFSDGGTYKYRVDGQAEQAITSGGTLKLKHGQTACFVGLPVGLQYTITEQKEENYLTNSSAHQGSIKDKETSTAIFVNTYDETPMEGNIELTVTKKVEGKTPKKDKNKEFWFTLNIEDEEPIRFSLKDGQSKTFTIPAGKSYTVTEDDYFGDGYILWSVVGGSGTSGSVTTDAIFTNVYVGTEMIEIPGEKKWDLTNAPEGTILPDSIEVYLINKNTGNIEQIKIVKPDKDGKWKYTFTAPKYDSSGKEIKYEIKEKTISGYVSSVNGNNITNTYVKPVTTNIPTVKKIVKGENATKETFAFKLTGHAGAPMPERSVNGVKIIYINSNELNIEKDFGKITFTVPGTYTYTISEISGNTSGYTYDNTVYNLTIKIQRQGDKLSVVSKTLSGGSNSKQAVFTNKYEKLKETINISGMKSWVHGENTDPNKHPKSVTIQVKNGNNVVIEKVITAKEHWYYSFTLPKYDSKGNEINYTVDELPVNGYEKIINGTNITNYHKSVNPNPDPSPNPDDQNQDTVVIIGTKTWNHGSIKSEHKPESIIVQIKNNGKVVAEQKVSAKDGWNYVFKLDKYDKKGNEINYTVDEQNVPYYTASFNGYNIYNTYKGMDYLGDSPSTGYNRNIILWSSVMAISFMGLIGCFVISQKRKKKYKPMY